jgi:dihydroflavonol-4-reductase
VRTTVRSLSRADAVRAAIAAVAPAAADPARLSFHAADLTSDAGWAQAVEGVRFVHHVASPLGAEAPKHEDELIVPARDGALRVLKASVAAGVERVVATSSMAAIAYGHPAARYKGGPPFTEADWTDPTQKDATPYVRSKTLAERASRAFRAEHGGKTEFATVNPAAVFGPVMSRDYSPSILVIERILKGQLPGLPNIGFCVVDVRDVADLHLLAMQKPEAAGGRYAAGGDFLWFADIARLLREILPASETAKVPRRVLPDLLLRGAALFDPQVRSIINEVGRRREMSSDHAKALGWTPRPVRETLKDTADSLKAVGAL